MLINFIKFFHLLIVLGLLGTITYCLIYLPKAPKGIPHTLYKKILWLALLGMATGTLLVHPKHFTFHTPWILAAYFLMTVFATTIFFLQKKPLNKFFLTIIYFLLILLLILVIHDAVTKTTFL